MAAVQAEVASAISKRKYLLELGAILALLAVFLSMMSAYQTVGAGVGPKLFLVGRMVLLVALCTWLLRRDGERWRDLGLRRPARWWVVPLLVLGGFVLLVVLSGWLRSVVLPAIGAPPPQPSALAAIRGDLTQYLFYGFIVSWGSAAFGEELLLRGFVLDRLVKLNGQNFLATIFSIVAEDGALMSSFSRITQWVSSSAFWLRDKPSHPGSGCTSPRMWWEAPPSSFKAA